VRPRGGATSTQWLGEEAEARARRGLPGGGHGSSGSGQLVGRSGQQAGAQAHMVLGEGLGVLWRDWGLAEHQARRGVPMAGRQWTRIARGEEAATFKAGREVLRLLPCVPR
jgi:hypothetical protein